jgi:hypothetical protein
MAGGLGGEAEPGGLTPIVAKVLRLPKNASTPRRQFAYLGASGDTMKKYFVALAALVALAGCATPPKQTAFSNTQTYQSSKDQVWSDLLAFFTSNNIQIKTIEKDSGVIYAERSRSDPSMADCGQDLAVELSRPATLNVFVKPEASGTTVTVNATFEVIRSFDNRTWTAPCHSTGVLERQILSSIK